MKGDPLMKVEMLDVRSVDQGEYGTDFFESSIAEVDDGGAVAEGEADSA